MTINLTDADLEKNPTLKQQMLFELEWDERKHKKQYNSLIENCQDFEDYISTHKIEHEFQSVVRNNYLDSTHGITVYDLKLRLKREYLLGNENINRIAEHLVNNNRFVEVDDKGQDNPMLFELYKHPRREPAEHPHSIWIPSR